jgi:imidazolonepropionase-like amidohydrolase
MKNDLRKLLVSFIVITFGFTSQAQQYVLLADQVFDGEQLHSGWTVVVEGNKIIRFGPSSEIKSEKNQIVLKFPGKTLLPGLIEGHSHLLLHPYNETPWDNQVLMESDALRVARGTVHAKNTLLAGFTTVRDLGSEGAGYADVGLKQAIDQGIIPGPRMIVAGRAIVATGSYGPKGFDNDFNVMLGAEPADGQDLIRVVRDQIGRGADIIKVYADYRWGLNGEARPTFSLDELKLIVETAASSGRSVVAHAATEEGMRRAALAGVQSIEHGDHGSPEIFRLMKENGVALCPTLAAGEATSQYSGWRKGVDPVPVRVTEKRKSFTAALLAGVTICAGGDVGVFPHGQNVRELELMVEYGMNPIDVLRSATSINAAVFHISKDVGKIQVGLQADILVVNGDPTKNISDLRKVEWIMKNGKIVQRQ